LVHLFVKASRGEPATSAVIMLCLAVTLLHADVKSLYADTKLRIDSPENGLMVNPGADLTVLVEKPTVALQSVSIVGDGPFELSTPNPTPPYQFSYRISPGLASGRYHFKAEGITVSGTMVYSDPVEVDIEQPEQPKKLESGWQLLSLTVNEKANLIIWGIFPNGLRVDVTRSTLIAYASDRPDVAAVSNEGCITGNHAGKAKITVKYADRTVVLPVQIQLSPAH
jgi:hypothetical protein